MKKSLFIFILMLTNVSLGATLEEWKKTVVKVRSYPCLSKRPMFEGSGVLLKDADKLYALTSEHVLFHDKGQKICHEVFNASTPHLRMELTSLAYTKGLALLSLPLSPSLNAFGLPLSSLNGDLVGTTFSAIGYPVSSTSQQVLTGGKLISKKSPRSLIPAVTEMIELSGLPLEYGMSGGVLLGSPDGKNYYFGGILSHQILKRVNGRATEVSVMSTDTFASMGDLALAIGAPVIYQWFLDKNPEDLWRRHLAGQLNKKDVLTYGPLLFELEKTSDDEIFGVGGGDGAGVGGGDGAGVGGGDGAGVGGDTQRETTSDDKQSHTIVNVVLNPDADFSAKSQNLKNDYLNKWLTWLNRGEKVRVIYLKDSSSNRLLEFRGLEGFLTPWLRGEKTPVALRSNRSDKDLSIKKLSLLKTKVLSIIELERSNLEDLSLVSWLGLVRDTVILVDEGIISTKDLKELMEGNNSDMWNAYYSNHFDGALELESSLIALMSQMEKMGL